MTELVPQALRLCGPQLGAASLALSVSRRRPMTMPESIPTSTRTRAVRHWTPGPSASITIVAPAPAPRGAADQAETKRSLGDRDQVEGANGPPASYENTATNPIRPVRRTRPGAPALACVPLGRARRPRGFPRRPSRGEKADDRPRPGLLPGRELVLATATMPTTTSAAWRSPSQPGPVKHRVAPPAASRRMLRARASRSPGRLDTRTRRPLRRRHPRCLPRRAR